METQGALIRGLSKLAFEAGAGLTELVESMHLNIARSPGVFGAPLERHAPGIAGFVYRSVSGAFKLTGGAVDAALAALEPFLSAAGSSPQMDDALAALNGVMGDHLVATGNPLAIPMRLRADGEELHLARDALAARFARPSRPSSFSSTACASATATGDEKNTITARRWPAISDTRRSICATIRGSTSRPMGRGSPISWKGSSPLGRLSSKKLRSSGTAWGAWWRAAHAGAPAERAGQWIDALLGKIPYTAPFARLSRIRSAGVTDLRYGFIADEDWEGRDRHENSGDTRRIVPLPKDARSFAIAGSIAPTSAGAIVGDGLVTTASALGRHNDPERDLSLPESQRWVAPSVNHLELLNSPSVYEKMRSWLS